MDKPKVYSLNFLALLIVAVFLYWLFGRVGRQRLALVDSFDKCVKKGYPVTQTSPRQCRLPGGEIFTETLPVAQLCVADADCGAGKFCGQGRCRDFLTEVACQTTDDCKLINRDLNYGCCWAGVCRPIDYSKDNWAPVNRQWFEAARTKICSPEVCGPQPACPARLVNDNYEARCAGGLCEKLPVRRR